MTLRRKTLIIISGAVIALVVLLYAMQHLLILHGFRQLEQRSSERNVQRAQSAIQREVEHLDLLVNDWSSWDDTYRFMADGNAAYRQSNLSDQSLVDARLSLLLLADAEGQIVYGRGYDLAAGQPLELPDLTSQTLPALQALLTHSDTSSHSVGLLLLARGPLLVASRPILTTAGEGPARGTLVMGRWLDQALLAQLAESLQLDLSLERLGADELPADARWARTALNAATPVVVRALDQDTVAGYALLRDVQDRPVLLLRVANPRDIYRFGATMFLYLALTTAILVPLSAGGILLVLEREVLQRIRRLGTQVRKLGQSHDLAARLSLGGQDELHDLADDINVMLGDLQAADDSIRQRERSLQGLAAAAQALLRPGSDIPYQTFLEVLGRSSRASRAYVFLNQRGPDGQLHMSQETEWCAPGIVPQIDNPRLQDVLYPAAGFQRWNEVFSRGEPINDLVVNLPPAERRMLELQDVKAILVLPLLVNGGVAGFIGFDQCAEAREWDAAELDLLRAAAADLAQALKHKRDEQVQAATYRISQAAQSVQNLDELFPALHVIVGELMPADNFYIALYDEDKGLLEFRWFVDQFDQTPEPRPLGRGLTEYVLRTGQPLLADPTEFQRLLAEGQVDDIGTPSIDWLGVPLQVHDKTIGVLVVQSYTEGVRYDEQHKDILTFVSTQVAMAIERKRSDDALRRSEQRYRTIFETTGTAAIIIEADTTISLANRQFEKLSGYSRDEIEGKKSWTEVAAPGALERMKEYHQLRRQNPDSVPNNYEFSFTNRQGDRRDLLVTIAMIPGTQQSVASLLDVTEHRQAEAARRDLEAQLRQAQKMEAVGLLAGGVAHDFNNLLTVILGNSELGLQQLQPEQPLHRELSTIERAARRGASLTQQLLAFSRRQVLQPGAVDVNQLITDMTRMLGRLIGMDVDLRLELCPDVACVNADAGALDQMLMNLTLNARDAMPQGGTLTIHTAHVSPSGEYLRSHPEAKPGRYVRVAVADTGVGIDAAVQSHLFEPFFTTKEVGKGTGLGLSVVYGIVQQHHGWIDVTSHVGQGTCFDIYLPAADGAGSSEA